MTENIETSSPQYLLFEPIDAPKALIVIWPALGVTSSYYAEFCNELNTLGIAVAAADLPGRRIGSKGSNRTVGGGYHELASEYWPRVIASAIKKLNKEVPVYILGHSIGGQISTLYLSGRPRECDGLILVASGSVHYKTFEGIAKIAVLVGTQLITLISALFGYWPGGKLGFGGMQSGQLMRDWARFGRTGRLSPSGSDVEYEKLLPLVTTAVLAISIEGDRLAPKSAVDKLCEKLPNSIISRLHYDPKRKTSNAHIRWARKSRDIASFINSWIAEQKPAR
ncbi:alpha/beta hydrolase family protein [Streptomyces sp. 3211]|uniref:alpha/beta hydrolase family protein n=1 Tax=Streptomyces sp. 3211 TaxID=1964449 RepID=UPI0013318260|nr:alpha/beta fold hydrolase [Streptomyces sp. 3211]